MYDRAFKDYDQAIRIKPNHATIYLNRGALYHYLIGALTDAYDRAIEDCDNVVRLCPNYETDFMDRNFAYGGQGSVDRAIKLLDSRIEDINNPKSATDFYYLGVESLFRNDRLTAQRCFEWAQELDYDDGANGAKIAKHLDNLTNRDSNSKIIPDPFCIVRRIGVGTKALRQEFSGGMVGFVFSDAIPRFSCSSHWQR